MAHPLTRPASSGPSLLQSHQRSLAMKLKDNLEPTDFINADCRLTDWLDFAAHGIRSYRIWLCQVGNHWFQRHEWLHDGKNETQLDDWIYRGIISSDLFAGGGFVHPAPP